MALAWPGGGVKGVRSLVHTIHALYSSTARTNVTLFLSLSSS
jgi:hypothetical protein